MKLFLGALLSGLMLSSLTLPALAGTIRHDYNDADYQDFGASEAFASVGAIIGASGQGLYGCSGTAIDQHWVLTAAHCVDEASDISFYLPDGKGSMNEFVGSSWEFNQNFTGNNLLSGWDIGLVYFKQSLTVNPATIYKGNNEAGNLGAIVGFGTSGDGLSGVSGPFGTKRAGLNMVTFAWSTEGSGEQILFGDFDPPVNDNPNNALDFFGDGYAIPYEYSPAFGDSGGGLFIYENNQFYLAGINSFGGDANQNGLNADYGDYFGATRVSSFAEWINARVGRSVPEPSGGVLLLIALAGLLVGRARRK